MAFQISQLYFEFHRNGGGEEKQYNFVLAQILQRFGLHPAETEFLGGKGSQAHPSSVHRHRKERQPAISTQQRPICPDPAVAL